MRGENLAEARVALDAAIAAAPGDVPLRLAAAKLLEYAGEPDAAYGVLDEGLGEGLPVVLSSRGGGVVPMHKVPRARGTESALFSRVPRRSFGMCCEK